MPDQYEEKRTSTGELTRVLASTFAPGRPEGKGDGGWRHKLANRTEALRYLRSAERYWYGESFGSEKRSRAA